jgi:hypothetical protein
LKWCEVVVLEPVANTGTETSVLSAAFALMTPLLMLAVVLRKFCFTSKLENQCPMML